MTTPKEEEIRAQFRAIGEGSVRFIATREEVLDFIFAVRREAIAEERTRIIENVGSIIEKYEDKGDERYGYVKHNNTILQRIKDHIVSNLSQQ